MMLLIESIIRPAAFITLLCSFVLLAGCNGEQHASVYTPVEKLVFKDRVLHSCVLEQARHSGWKTSGEMTELTCSNPEREKVKSIAGIENLVNLQELNLAHNEISDTALINRLERLKRVDLGYNRIKSVDLNNLRVVLNSLNLDHNEISDISSLSEMHQLERLSISHNLLQSFSP